MTSGNNEGQSRRTKERKINNEREKKQTNKRQETYIRQVRTQFFLP
jgi:hypothetical protein